MKISTKTQIFENCIYTISGDMLIIIFEGPACIANNISTFENKDELTKMECMDDEGNVLSVLHNYSVLESVTQYYVESDNIPRMIITIRKESESNIRILELEEIINYLVVLSLEGSEME